ncbi:MAG: histidine ammonia-lyase [bacterium]
MTDRPVVPLDGTRLDLEDLEALADRRARAELTAEGRSRMEEGATVVARAAAGEEPVYGVNTGFGRFAEVRIPFEEAARLQINLVRSHCAGVGEPFPQEVVRAMMVTRANVLARGSSGVRPVVVERLLQLLESGLVPRVPSQGSVGASGDLTPLSHLALFLIGEGEGWDEDGHPVSAAEGLAAAGIEPLHLHPKEGLALLNGTQASLSVAALTLLEAERLVRTADVVGALTVEGLKGSTTPFRPEVFELRPHHGPADVGANVLALMEGSEIRESHLHCGRVQDAYSLRCMPQVHGAIRAALAHVREVLEVELNAVTDNPLVLPGTGETLSAGNFHGEPIALVMDYLALAMADLANISERRIAAMMEAPGSDLATFLAERGGLQSGFMMSQVTAAALVSENKGLAHPASVDSVPTGAGREDHVSMSPIAARKASRITDHTRSVLAIETLCAVQAIDFHAPLEPGRGTAAVHRAVRDHIPHLAEDRVLSADIETARGLLADGTLIEAAEVAAGPLR